MALAFLQVALGGALGAIARFGLGLALARDGFPLAVLIANVLGSFLMGLAVVWLHHKGQAHWQPFVMAGLLGGFTTFSAFSLEAVILFERGDLGQAAAYVALSVAGALMALAGGVALMRAALA